jgi:hypothetical protein
MKRLGSSNHVQVTDRSNNGSSSREKKLWLDAYEQGIDFQNRVAYLTSLVTNPEFDLPQFLGYMLLETPTVEGRTNLSGEMLECTTDEQRSKLAVSYYIAFS